jgi:hypothetical protein
VPVLGQRADGRDPVVVTGATAVVIFLEFLEGGLEGLFVLGWGEEAQEPDKCARC